MKEDELRESVKAKLEQAEVKGCVVEFTAEEAEFAGAFEEDALSEEDAYESTRDLVDNVFDPQE